MLNWLKRKKTKPQNAVPTRVAIPSREEAMAGALKNMQEIREKIGEEKLQKLANMILQKKLETDDISPSIQAKKIIAHMDKEKLGQFMKFIIQDNQTKH